MMDETKLNELGILLLAAAKSASTNAFSPFSELRVGAAISSRAGNIYTGCNIENPSFSATICAERCALAAMVAEEGLDARISAIAVWCDGENPCYPCGVCRQALLPFYDDETLLIVEDGGDAKAMQLSSLLPHAFKGW
jgi:cytidine deaminase